ncbi:MAG: DNA primase [Rickettsiaceae bacterium]|nr:MAG: DNA primase [Rickettsiaceae bacterium]
MRIPLDFYETIRDRVNLSEIVRKRVSLTRKAREYVGLCPFHQEKSPSFTVSDFKKFYHCFGCGAHGDVIKFVSQFSGLSYRDSAVKLAGDHGIELPKVTREQELFYEEADHIFGLLELAADFFSNSHNAMSLSYLDKRGINAKTMNKFDIGFAPGSSKLQKFFEVKRISPVNIINAGIAGKREDGSIYEIFHKRLIFPIRNVYNKIVGFGGRVLDDALPKYINSPETIVFKKGDTLYGENLAITAAFKKNYIILVEGYLDVIALHQAGYVESVASLGTAITENHLKKLWKTVDEIVVCLDGDQAGLRASNRLINLVLPLISHEKKISFIILPPGDDPDDVLKKNEKEFFQTLVNERINLSEMIWRSEYGSKNYSTPEDRAIIESSLVGYSNLIKDKILRKNYYNFFHEQIWRHLNRRQTTQVKNLARTDITNSVKNELENTHNYTEIEILEYAFCWVVMKFPDLLHDELIAEDLNNFDFKNTDLAEFRDWLFKEFNQSVDFRLEIIEQTVKNTGFYDTFLLLIKLNNQFFSKSFSQNADEKLIWEILQKKHYLASLKQEYTFILQNEPDNAFKKVTFYQEEITRTSSELQKLSESFTNY